MKLTVTREALMGATAHLSRIVERRNTIPILSNLLLRATDSGLTLTATDLDIEGTSQVAATVATPGAITLPAAPLKDIAAKVAGRDISIDATGPQDRVVITSGRARFTLDALPEADFPDLASGDMPAAWRIPAGTLLALLETVQFAISTEVTRYYLNGIHLHVTEHDGAPHLTAVATDGHRLALRRVPAPDGAAAMPAVIVPRKAVGEMVKLLPPLGSDLVDVAVSPTKLRLQAGGTRLITKLIDGNFPDYARVIPQPGTTQVVVKRADFAAAIARVAAVSSERGRAVKFAFDEGAVTLKVTNPDAGEAVDVVETEHDGPPVEIGFNGAYALDITGVMAAADLRLSLGDPGSPALLTGADDPAALFVLMPMRV